MSDDKQTALTITEVGETEVAPRNPTDILIELAIQHGADVDKLERLIALKNSEEARRAKLEYDRHFAEMQSEFTPVSKEKEARDQKDGKLLYKYAGLDQLQKLYGPIIAAHGFSYRWYEQALEGESKRVVLRISGYGHAEENYFDLPKAKAPLMNDIQAAGSMSTYGRRYTFIAGLGVIIDDDDDGRADIETTLDCAEELKALTECETAANLLEVAAAIIKPLAKGSPKRKLLEVVYRKRRKDLTHE